MQAKHLYLVFYGYYFIIFLDRKKENIIINCTNILNRILSQEYLLYYYFEIMGIQIMDKPNKNDENCQERPMNTNFEEIFYQSPLGIVLYDKKGRLINANDSALNIARIPKLDDILDNNIFDIPTIAF